MGFEKQKEKTAPLTWDKTYSEDELIQTHYEYMELKEKFGDYGIAEIRWYEKYKAVRIYTIKPSKPYDLYTYGVVLPVYNELHNKFKQYQNWADRFYSLETFGIPKKYVSPRKYSKPLFQGSKDLDIQKTSPKVSSVPRENPTDRFQRILESATRVSRTEEPVPAEDRIDERSGHNHGSEPVPETRPIEGDSVQTNDMYSDLEREAPTVLLLDRESNEQGSL